MVQSSHPSQDSTANPQRVGEPAAEQTPIVTALRAAAEQASSKQDFYRTALRKLATHFDAPFALMNLDSPSGTMDDCVSHHASADERWKPLCSGMLLDARYRNLSVAKLYDSIALNKSFAALAAPVGEDARSTIGSLLVVTQTTDKNSAQAQLTEFQTLVALAGTLAASIQRKSEADTSSSASNGSAGWSGLTKVAEHQSVYELAFALVNGLKSRVGCDQVSLGLVHHQHLRVLCISGLDDLYPRTPGSRLIHHAMEECLDAGEMVCYQLESDQLANPVSTRHLLHKQWHHATGNSCVATVPLEQQGQRVAILSLRRGANRPFRADELQRIQQTVLPLVPGLLLLARAGRGLHQHLMDSARTSIARWISPNHRVRRAVAATVGVLSLWCLLGTTTHHVTVPCEVVPRHLRQIAAPFEARIMAAHVRPGDRVEAGQLLLELDTRELELKRAQLKSQQSIAELEMTRALQSHQHAPAAQAAARARMASSELAVVEGRIAAARICAPTTGYLLLGDVVPRVDEIVPMGEPLVQLAPADDMQIELHAPEFSATYLQAGQVVEFTTNARPDQQHRCHLHRVEVAAEIIQGKNVFVAEANLQATPEWLRTGMTGVARVDAGRQPIWWVGLHRLIDSIRLQLWKL